MFSTIGWGEIFFIVLLGIVIVGPERLPGVLEDVRAAVFAARKAIANAKRELNGEFEPVRQEFQSLAGPLSEAAQWGRLGPKAALTKVLFDGDEDAWNQFNPGLAPPSQNPAASGGHPSAGNPTATAPNAGSRFSYGDIGDPARPYNSGVEPGASAAGSAGTTNDAPYPHGQHSAPQSAPQHGQQGAPQHQAQGAPQHQAQRAPQYGQQGGPQATGGPHTGGFSWADIT